MAKIYLVTVDIFSQYGLTKRAFLTKEKAELYIECLYKNCHVVESDISIEEFEAFDDFVADAYKYYVYYARYYINADKVNIAMSAVEVPSNLDEPIEVDPVYLHPSYETSYIHKYSALYETRILSYEKLSYNQIDKITRERVAKYNK